MHEKIPIPLILTAIFSSSYIFWEWQKFLRKKNSSNFVKTLFVTFIWGFVLFFSLFPYQALGISEKLGLGKTLNALIFLGFILVFWSINKIFIVITKLKDTQTKIIRYIALQEAKEKYEI